MGRRRTESLARAAVYLSWAILIWPTSTLAAGPVPGRGTWETTLQARDLDRDGVTDAFYDTDLNITWLRDTNYGAGSPFDAGFTTPALGPKPANYATDGKMTFNNAKAWASSLTFGGYSDWRLPALTEVSSTCCIITFNGSDIGYNVPTATSELAHLFHVTLGNVSRFDTNGNERPQAPALPGDFWLVNTGNFLNLQPSSYYAQSRNPSAFSGGIWTFYFGFGAQLSDPGTYDVVSAIAVRAGDVAAVPELEVWAMMATGLAMLGIASKRRGPRNQRG